MYEVEIVGRRMSDPIDTGKSNTGASDFPAARLGPGQFGGHIIADGRRVYDSRVINEQLDILAGGGKIVPADPKARIDALVLQALGDGIMDAGILVVYEGRMRPENVRHAPWVEYQRDKLKRGLVALATKPPDPTKVTVGTIAVACALGYIDWRKQSNWRADHPSLVGWLEEFRKACPGFDATTPPEE